MGGGWWLSRSPSLLHLETAEEQAQGHPPHALSLRFASHLCAQELEASAKAACLEGWVPRRTMELAARHKLPCVLCRGSDGSIAVLLRKCLTVRLN